MKDCRRKETVIRTTLLDAEKAEVFRMLQKLETLQYVAAPYARFISVDKKQVKWVEGSVFKFHFYLFGFIPLGIHTINVLYCCENLGIGTEEYNSHISVWNHRIYLESLGGKRTRYTDEVEIEAGWKTPIVALWAKAFYSHRQRKWKKLLSTVD
jgi:hypothetical protein